MAVTPPLADEIRAKLRALAEDFRPYLLVAASSDSPAHATSNILTDFGEKCYELGSGDPLRERTEEAAALLGSTAELPMGMTFATIVALSEKLSSLSRAHETLKAQAVEMKEEFHRLFDFEKERAEAAEAALATAEAERDALHNALETLIQQVLTARSSAELNGKVPQ